MQSRLRPGGSWFWFRALRGCRHRCLISCCWQIRAHRCSVSWIPRCRTRTSGRFYPSSWSSASYPRRLRRCCPRSRRPHARHGLGRQGVWMCLPLKSRRRRGVARILWHVLDKGWRVRGAKCHRHSACLPASPWWCVAARWTPGYSRCRPSRRAPPVRQGPSRCNPCWWVSESVCRSGRTATLWRGGSACWSIRTMSLSRGRKYVSGRRLPKGRVPRVHGCGVAGTMREPYPLRGLRWLHMPPLSGSRPMPCTLHGWMPGCSTSRGLLPWWGIRRTCTTSVSCGALPHWAAPGGSGLWRASRVRWMPGCRWGRFRKRWGPGRRSRKSCVRIRCSTRTCPPSSQPDWWCGCFRDAHFLCQGIFHGGVPALRGLRGWGGRIRWCWTQLRSQNLLFLPCRAW